MTFDRCRAVTPEQLTIAFSEHATPWLTPQALRSRGIAMLAFAAFAAWWATSALHAARTPFGNVGYLPVALISGALIVIAFRVLRSGNRLAHCIDVPTAPQRATSRIFVAIFIAELLLINLGASLLESHHRASFLPALVAVVVGAHFFPLASVFRTPHYRLTATAMTLVGIAAAAALIAGCKPNLINATLDTACAVSLWITALLSWRFTERALTLAASERRGNKRRIFLPG